MAEAEYANAYSEVLEILKHVSKNDYNKIPKSKIEIFKKNFNKDYNFIYNPNLTLDEQNVSKRTKAIIAILFRDYWATDIQKKKIINRQNYSKMLVEKEKQKKYNKEDLFGNNENYGNKKVATTEKALMREKWYEKIIRKIRSIFIKKNK